MKLDLYQSLPLGNTFSAGFGNACIHKMGLASNPKVQKVDMKGGKELMTYLGFRGGCSYSESPKRKQGDYDAPCVHDVWIGSKSQVDGGH